MKLRTVLAGVSLATVMLWAAGAAIAGEDKGKKKKAQGKAAAKAPAKAAK